jgi:hypothetical protein
VGETTRLYRRWNEHCTGRGGVTTSSDEYDTLIGLYNVSHNINFLDYFKNSLEDKHDWTCEQNWNEDVDRSLALEIENHITERYRHEHLSKNWWDINGGKYCGRRGNVLSGSIVVDRPLCKCGHPCEVNLKNDKTKIYFTCPVPEWVAFDNLNVPSRCSFWEEFKPYRTLREAHTTRYFEKKRVAFIQACTELTDSDFTT